jgi:hypothetical protein
MKFNVIHDNGPVKIKISQVTVTYCMMERRSKKHLFTANPSEVTHRATGTDFLIQISFIMVLEDLVPFFHAHGLYRMSHE